MKKLFSVMALGTASLLSADPSYYGYTPPCQNGGNCGGNYNNPYYQGQGYYQGQPQYYQGQGGYTAQPPSQGGYDQRNDQFSPRNQPNGPYSRQEPQGYYQGQPQYYQGQGGYAAQPPSQNGYDQRNDQFSPRNQPNGPYPRQAPQDYNDNRQGMNNDNGQRYNNGQGDNSRNNQNVSDQEIAAKLRNTLSSGWLSKGFQNVSFSVNDGNVTLKGSVNSQEDKNKIEESVRKINRVKQIDNQITVTGPQTADNDPTDYNDNSKKISDEQKNYPQDVGVTSADQSLNAKIRDKISNGWFSNSYDNLKLSTNNGDVTVSGTVDSADDIKKINDQLKDIKEIRSIKNQATVKTKQS